MPTENEPVDLGFDLNTPDGGRSYIASLFKTVLKRHDYRQYINERLAGDFACTLAQHLESLKAREQALQLRLNAADQRIDDLAAAAEPFAKVADLYAGEEDNSHEPARDMGMHDDLRLTLGQYRALSDLCTRPLMVRCKKGILCGDVSCECKGNGFVERKTAAQPFTEQFIQDHLGNPANYRSKP